MDFKFAIKTYTTILLCFVITFSCYKISAQTNKYTQIKNELFTICNESIIPGFSVSIFTPDQVFFQESFGYSNLEKKIPYSLDTVQYIGSLSKPFIGVAIMQCIEKGLFSLDEDINNLLPFKVINPFFKDETITIRHLATHTSGIRDNFKFYIKTYFAPDEKRMELRDYLKKYLTINGEYYSKKNFTNLKPGSLYIYSNIGATLAAYIIEYQTGIPFYEYVRENIFKPLGMNNTSWFLNEINPQNLAVGYSKNKYNINTKTFFPSFRITPVPDYEIITYPDGGIRSNVQDLTRFLQAIMKNEKLDQEQFLLQQSIDEMLSKQLDSDKVMLKGNEGIFWNHMPNGLIGHSGGDPGITTFMYMNPEKTIAFCLLINYHDEVIPKKDLQAIFNAISKFIQQ